MSAHGNPGQFPRDGDRVQFTEIPPQPHRCHCVRTRVEVREYNDGRMAVFHGRHELGRYDSNGSLLDKAEAAA